MNLVCNEDDQLPDDAFTFNVRDLVQFRLYDHASRPTAEQPPLQFPEWASEQFCDSGSRIVALIINPSNTTLTNGDVETGPV